MEEPQFNQCKRLLKAALDEAREQAVAAKDVLALIWLDQFEALVLDENGEIDRAIEEWAWQTLDPFNEAPAHLRPAST
jgi:hypothetical protein